MKKHTKESIIIIMILIIVILGLLIVTDSKIQTINELEDDLELKQLVNKICIASELEYMEKIDTLDFKVGVYKDKADSLTLTESKREDIADDIIDEVTFCIIDGEYIEPCLVSIDYWNNAGSTNTAEKSITVTTRIE